MVVILDCHDSKFVYGGVEFDWSEVNSFKRMRNVETGAILHLITLSDGTRLSYHTQKSASVSVFNNTYKNFDDFTIDRTFYTGENKSTKIQDCKQLYYTGSQNSDILDISGSDSVFVYAGDGDDYIKISDSAKATIFSGSGNDVISSDNVDHLNIIADDGNDFVDVQNAEKVTVSADKGDKNIFVNTAKKANIFSGTGNDKINVANIAENLRISSGDGDDEILVQDGTVSNEDDALIFTGNGRNFVAIIQKDQKNLHGKVIMGQDDTLSLSYDYSEEQGTYNTNTKVSGRQVFKSNSVNQNE